jgi:hypothetical protein
MKYSLRRTLGVLTAALGMLLAVLAMTTSPAAAYEGSCTPTDANSGSCVLDETNGSDPSTWGTMTYSRVGDVITFNFDQTLEGESLLACFSVAGAFPEEGQPCVGNSNPQYNGDFVDPLVINLADPPTGNEIPNFDSGDQVYFAVHVNQGGRTTYGIGGAGGGGSDCVPTTDNNQCSPCDEGESPDGQGNCTEDCVPTTDNNQCTPCPEGQLPDGQGSCTPPPPPPPAFPVLDSSIECATGGLLVTVTNTGGAAGNTSVTNNGDVVNGAVLVPAGGKAEVLVPVAEDTAYAIVVTGVDTFNATRNCTPPEEILPEVIVRTPTPEVIAPAATPQAKPTQVAGVQVTRAAQQLPRTGSDTLPLLQIGFGLMLLGAGVALFSKESTATI